MRWQGDIDEFVSLFLIAPPDQTPLQQALTSIPQERWWAVWGRIVVGLDNEIVKILPQVEATASSPVTSRPFSDKDDELLGMIELKERLLHQEGQRRLTKPR